MKKIFSPKYILIFIIFLALIIRIFSVSWNTIPQGDIVEDSAAAASFYKNGTLMIEKYNPSESAKPYLYSIEKKGGRFLIQHPPIWPLLGAGLSYLLKFDASPTNTFFSFKILSLLSGLALIILSYLIAKKLLDQTAGLIIAAWLSFSYLMIDYSGNGAFYSLHAALYLLWILVVLNKNLRGRLIYLGLIGGIGYLINFQFLIVTAASVVILIFEKGSAPPEQKPIIKKVKDISIVCLVSLITVVPWLIRNFILFGDPLFSNYFAQVYIFQHLGLSQYVKDDILYFNHDFGTSLLILKASLTSWLPRNLYYVARKFFILASLAFIFFSFAVVDYVFNLERLKKWLPVILILTLHILISVAWPITKFRYFVPALPLVFLIALDQIYNIKIKKIYKNLIIILIFVSIISLSFLTYRSTPSHTYYNDGAVTTGPFGDRAGEEE